MFSKYFYSELHIFPKLLCERCSAFNTKDDNGEDDMKELNKALENMNTRNKEIRDELQNEIGKSEGIANQLDEMERLNTEAKQIIKNYVVQDEIARKEIQGMKETMIMYKEQLASAVLEKDNVNRELEDTLVTLQWEKRRNGELHGQVLALQEKLNQSNIDDEKSTTGSPCSFEEFVAMKREIKLLKLEIMSMKEATEHQGRGRGKASIPVKVGINASKESQGRTLLKKSSSSSRV